MNHDEQIPRKAPELNRRTFSTEVLATATGVAGLTAAMPSLADETTRQREASGLMPSIFVAHGNPMFMNNAPWQKQLHQWMKSFATPRAILMISAHWIDRPITLGATRTVPLTYDYYGFPKHYYEVEYTAPGAPGLAKRIRELLSSYRVKIDDAPDRGLDHGAFIPLRGMYPKADVPVLQMSIPTMEPGPLIELGRRLAPLRREGVLIVGSGFLTHNIRSASRGQRPKTPTWAKDFDAWAEDAISRRDVNAMTQLFL